MQEHEQGHYDVAALAAREFLNEAQGLTVAQARSLWDNIQARFNTLQNRYDSSTNHGLNRTTQVQWSAEITSLKGSDTGTFTALEQWAMSI